MAYNMELEDRIDSHEKATLELRGLKEYGKASGDAEARLQIMERMTARLLVRTCLGIGPDHVDFADLEQQFLTLGPNRFVWKVGDELIPEQSRLFDHSLSQ